MELSAAGLEMMKKYEGFRGHVYLDVAGFPTIGYGHRLQAADSFPAGIDEAQAERLLAADVRTAELAVHRLVKVLMTQGQFDALVDFCYNLGAGKLAGSTLLRELNAGRFDAAREQLLRWDHAGIKEIGGLEARRAAEFQLWSGPGAASEAAA
jgi:lysozyme